jgi:hypothetical protein
MRPYHFKCAPFSNTTRQISATRSDLAVEAGMDSNGNDKTKLEEDICIHIFTVSSAMVGVCLTVIGVIRVVITLGRADTLADELLARDAFVIPNFVSPFLRRPAGSQFLPHASN